MQPFQMLYFNVGFDRLSYKGMQFIEISESEYMRFDSRIVLPLDLHQLTIERILHIIENHCILDHEFDEWHE